MDSQTLLAMLDFTRTRLLGSITPIEASGQDLRKVLGWRPGPGRAHIAWQLMHCAATHDRYLNVMLLGGKEKDPALVAAYAGGSIPADQNIPDLPAIRDTMERTFGEFRAYVAGLKNDDLARPVGPAGKEKPISDRLLLMAWHEAHHQGQIHLTWNLYKAAHGIG